MSALKAAGGLLLIVCGALGGLYLADKVRRRLRLFEEYEGFLLGAVSMIEHCSPDAQAIGEYCAQFPCLAAAGRGFSSAAENGSDPCIVWKAEVKQMSAQYGLSPKEEQLLLSFSEGFGEGDSKGEASRLMLIRDRTALHLEELRRESCDKSRTYRVVGTFVGALAAAILI